MSLSLPGSAEHFGYSQQQQQQHSSSPTSSSPPTPPLSPTPYPYFNASAQNSYAAGGLLSTSWVGCRKLPSFFPDTPPNRAPAPLSAPWAPAPYTLHPTPTPTPAPAPCTLHLRPLQHLHPTPYTYTHSSTCTLHPTPTPTPAPAPAACMQHLLPGCALLHLPSLTKSHQLRAIIARCGGPRWTMAMILGSHGHGPWWPISL